MAGGRDPIVAAALNTVINNQEAGSDQLHARAEYLLHAYDTIGVADVVGDPDDQVANDYRLALARLNTPPTRDELGELIRRLSSENISYLSDLEEFWVLRIQRGDPI